MATPSPNTLFELIRIGPLFEQLGVIVAFDDHRIQRQENIPQTFKDVPEVGQDPDAFLAMLDDKGNTVGSVMRGRNRVHQNRGALVTAKLNRFARQKMSHVVQPSNVAIDLNGAQ